MVQTARLAVKPELLQWACERSGVPHDDLVARFPSLPAWRRGEQLPTTRQLQDFAAATFTPFGQLFCDTPPADGLPIGDFRVRGRGRRERPSPHLLDTISLCQNRQDWYREYLAANDYGEIRWIGSGDIRSEPAAVAGRFEDEFGLSVQSRSEAATWDDALRRTRMSLEEAGVLVVVNGVVGNNTHRKLDYREFSGFALSDRVAPLVFINNADFKVSQMFTLAHEIGHLVLGESGVSTDSVGVDGALGNEAWCDRFAAALLVPATDLEAQIDAAGGDIEGVLQELAHRYKVSVSVVLRKLRTDGLIDRERYDVLDAAERDAFAQRRRQGDQGDRGGNFYNTFFQRTGRDFTRAVISSTLEGRTTYAEMFRLLGISSLATFDRVAVELGVLRS